MPTQFNSIQYISGDTAHKTHRRYKMDRNTENTKKQEIKHLIQYSLEFKRLTIELQHKDTLL